MMQKEYITGKQAIIILIMFLLGNNLIIGVNTESGQDGWIALLLSFVFVIPTLLIYARIAKLYPEKDLFEIIIEIFGKIAGKVVIALIIWFAIFLAAAVMRNFSEFIRIVAMPETPPLILLILMTAAIIYMIKSGLNVLGKWCVCILPIIILIIVSTFLLSIPNMKTFYIQPVMSHSIGNLFTNAFKINSFPFGDSVLLLILFNKVNRGDSPYKIFLSAALVTVILLLLVVLRNILVLGATNIASLNFPSYVAVRIISIGDSITRIEGSIFFNFILCGIVKIFICIFAAVKGFAKIIEVKEKNIISPVGLLTLAFCTIIFRNAVEMFDFLRLYPFYAAPFQLMIPILIWITAEIKHQLQKGKPAKNEI